MNSSRSTSVLPDEELRLPRTPGVIRRFWAKHPLLADVLITLVCVVLSVGPTGVTIFLSPGDETVFPSPDASTALVITATAIALLASLTLLVRRRWPVFVFIATYASALVTLLLIGSSSGNLLLVATYSLAVYRSTRAAWIGFGIGIAGYTLIASIPWETGATDLQSFISITSAQLVLTLIGTLVGVNVGGRKRYLEAIIARSRQLLIERDQQGQIAAAAERARIAREMHDVVSHSLTVVVALSEGAAATDDRERARGASTAAAATARSALTEMRAMLGVLRDGDADAPLAPAQPAAPQETVEAAQRAGYPATLTVTGSLDVPSTVGFAVGRIVQEGLTNAMRHARDARMIAVRIVHADDRVTVEIENDGVSGRSGTSGFGIRGLQERAAHIGGALSSAPAGSGRWMLRAELPLGTTNDEGEHE